MSGSTDRKPSSDGEMPGSTWNNHRAVWEKQHLPWECGWGSLKSQLLLIVQQFFKLSYLLSILIHISMYQRIYVSMDLWICDATHLHRVYLDWQERYLKAIAGMPGDED